MAMDFIEKLRHGVPWAVLREGLNTQGRQFYAEAVLPLDGLFFSGEGFRRFCSVPPIKSTPWLQPALEVARIGGAGCRRHGA